MGFIVLLSLAGHLYTVTNQQRVGQSGVQHTEEDQMLFETYEEAEEYAQQYGEGKWVVRRVQGEQDSRTGRINDWQFYKPLD